MWTILKLLGGIQPNYWGDISPLVSAPLDVRIGEGTVKITTILTVRAMLTSNKKYSGRARNKSGGGQCPLCPPAGDAPGIEPVLTTKNQEFLKFGRFKRKCMKTQGGHASPSCRRPYLWPSICLTEPNSCSFAFLQWFLSCLRRIYVLLS